jgi:hypothetical protein
LDPERGDVVDVTICHPEDLSFATLFRRHGHNHTNIGNVVQHCGGFISALLSKKDVRILIQWPDKKYHNLYLILDEFIEFPSGNGAIIVDHKKIKKKPYW